MKKAKEKCITNGTDWVRSEVGSTARMRTLRSIFHTPCVIYYAHPAHVISRRVPV